MPDLLTLRRLTRRCAVVLLLSLLVTFSGAAQIPTPAPPGNPPERAADEAEAGRVVPRELAVIRAGPGSTHAPVEQLRWGDTLRVLARSRSGLWTQISVERGEQRLSGWVPTGYLIFEDGASLAGVAVAHDAADADPSTVDSATLADLYSVPVLPEITAAMREVYAAGQAAGNTATGITKVGDSLSVSPIYLLPLNQRMDERRLDDDPGHDLGPYSYLQTTLDSFYGAVVEASVASQVGLSTYAVFDPTWATADDCRAGETPLACEFRRSRPAFAFVTFGPNDVRAMTAEEYAEQMRRIVEEALAAHVIPVLATFSVDPEDELWWQSVGFNLMLAEVAAEYAVPLVNLWAEARILPEYGLDVDGIHLRHSGFQGFYYPTGHEVYYGVSLQNLLALAMLDELRRALDLAP